VKYLLFFILLTRFLSAEELQLDNLLKQYEDSESLYKKTKKESAGFLLIYSRSDLEKMQAFHLRDVLKTIRLFNMQINQMGAIGILKSGSGKAAMPPIKLYIDDFELSTVLQRNMFDMYGNMDIYFVDHIEIYQGGSSIAFGNEVGSMVIRLYSKDPKRENSSSAQFSVDNKSGASLRAVDAGTMGEYNYLFYANAEKSNYDTYRRNNQELSRDGNQYQAHFKIAKDDDFVIEVDGILNKTDIFNGFGSAPTGGRTTRAYGYISATKYFPKNLEISISATQEVKEVYNTDANASIGSSIGLSSSSLHMNLHSNTYKSSIKKKIIKNNNDLLIGAEVQKKVFSVKSYDGFNQSPTFGPDELNIFMIYLEDLYNINKNNLLTFSAKLDRYENNFNKNSNEYSLRLGYIGLLNDTWKSKIFAVRRYVYPTMVQTSFSPPAYKINPDLEAADIDMLGGELEYKTDKNRLVFGVAYKETDNAIAMDKVQKMYINKNSTVYLHRYYLRAEHYFDIDNKIIIEGFKAFVDTYGSPGNGGLLQIFNTIGKFDIYNELVYRDGIALDYGMGDFKIDKGYDYTLSISYELSKHIKLKAKGENLLDKAIETPIDPQGLVQVPAIERRGILTMEYTF